MSEYDAFDPQQPHPPAAPPPPPDSSGGAWQFAFAGPFSVSGAFERGWEVFKSQYGVLLGATVLVMAISMGLSAVEMLANAVIFPAGTLLSWATSIFLMPVLQTGISFTAARAARGETVAFDHVFDGFRRYWPLVGVNALLLLCYTLAVLPFAAIAGVAAFALQSNPEAMAIVIAVTALVGCVVLLTLYARLAFAPLACLDPVAGTGVVDSIKCTWRITGPHWGGLIGLQLLFALIGVGTVLMCFVGVIFLGAPLILATTGAAYAALIGPLAAGGSCAACGYSLEGVDGRICPECGWSGPEQAPAPAF